MTTQVDNVKRSSRVLIAGTYFLKNHKNHNTKEIRTVGLYKLEWKLLCSLKCGEVGFLYLVLYCFVFFFFWSPLFLYGHVIESYFLNRPALASVMAPHSSKMKSSVKPKASRSELSMASAKSMVFVFSWPISHIWVAVRTFNFWKAKKHFFT